MSVERLELSTNGLKGRCSTIELHARGAIFYHVVTSTSINRNHHKPEYQHTWNAWGSDKIFTKYYANFNANLTNMLYYEIERPEGSRKEVLIEEMLGVSIGGKIK
jgi:hypothetical protein